MARRPAPPPRRRGRRRPHRITRDVAIITFALGFGAIELLFLGARTSALTFLGGLLLSPLVLHYDEARRET
jgi:hypothetical protein